MGKVIKIKLDEKETVEFYRDGASIVVARLDEEGFGQAAGLLTKENIKDLIELLKECTHENQFYEDIPGSDERTSICNDCGIEIV